MKKIGWGFLFGFALALLSACTTIPAPIENNLVLPHSFDAVGYRSTYHQKSLIAFEHVATLVIDTDRLIFKGESPILAIPYSDIRDVEYKKIYLTDPNNWVIVSYKAGDEKRRALFSAFRFAGWVGGSKEIYEAINVARGRFERNRSNHSLQSTPESFSR